MADKHHSGRETKKKQRSISAEQRRVLGMREEGDSDFNKSVLRFKDKIPEVIVKTIEQNGRIENQMSALDKESPVRAEYKSYLDSNKSFLDYVKGKE